MLQRGGRGPLPCRDSALTKLLSDVFMGRRKGTMIVAASAKETEREETLQVLRFTAVASDVFIAPRSTQCSKRKREQYTHFLVCFADSKIIYLYSKNYCIH